MVHTKTAIFFAAASLCSLAANAEVLTPQEALSRAQNTHQCKAVSASTTDFSLVYTSEIGGKPASYVFNSERSHSFVILSADDLVEPIQGYSDKGNFDPENIPENLAWKLGEYSRQIQWARQHETNNIEEYTSCVAFDPYLMEIEPLLTTRWSQDKPYNLFCPTNQQGQHAVTGCVATAMAQVMKYYEYPMVGTGSDYALMANEEEYCYDLVELDFAEHPFNWAVMRDEYNPLSMFNSKISDEAVANLMYCCGVSANMVYDIDGSGTSMTHALKGLVNHFDYDKGSRLLFHYYFNSYEWGSVVYNELSHNRPVLYAGGGHAFVCDGYRDGYFHMNWGWEGWYDGYFLLDLLDSTGDGSLVFSSDEQIIVGVTPAMEGSAQAYEFHSLVDFFVKTTKKQLGKKFIITSRLHATDTEDTWYYNDSSADYEGTFGLNVISCDGNLVYIAGDKNSINYEFDYDSPLPPLKSYKVEIPEDFPEGEYTIVPAFQPDGGEVTNINVYRGYVQAYKMTISGNYAYFEPIMPEYFDGLHVELEDYTLVVYDDQQADFTIKASNDTDDKRPCKIALGLYPIGSKEFSSPVFSADPLCVEIEPHSSIGATYTTAFTNAPSGAYMLYFYDVTNLKRLSHGLYVEVIHVSDLDGIANISFENPVVTTEYYDLQGRRITHPTTGGIYIKRSTHTDGTTTTIKVTK